ncbi:hypothetical protein PTKIN_Ptkin02bG0086300 [Pterospermum kingtungense]
MNVSVDSFCDPVGLKGLAHFLVDDEWRRELFSKKADDICGDVCAQVCTMKVTTKDDYILSMQGILVSRSGKTVDKSPVLLQHGIYWLIGNGHGMN